MQSDTGGGRGDVRPVPDPTRLTTEQLNREIASLREASEKGLAALREIIATRLDGNDRAIRLLQEAADRFPNWVDEKVRALKEVHEQRFTAITDTTTEKFLSIEKQFAERDVRTEQAAGAVKIAVDAALQAQKEAAGEQNRSTALAASKSETATTKQIDQLGQLIQTMTKASDDKFADVKERLTRIEGKGEVSDPQRAVDAATIQKLHLALERGSGKSEGMSDSAKMLMMGMALITGLMGFYTFTQRDSPRAPSAPQIIYVPAAPETLMPSPPSTP